MKSVLILITSILLLCVKGVMGQNCPATPTYRNVDGTFDFTAPGLSYVVDNGSSRSVTISKNMAPTSTICVRNGSTLNLTIALSGSSDIQPGAVIFIEAGAKLEVKGSSISQFPFTVINNGTFKQGVDIQLRNGASITNNGIYEGEKVLSLNEGYVTLLNNGTMTFSDVFSFTAGALSFKNLDKGSILFKSAMQINNADMQNKGTIRFDKTPVFKTSSLYNTNTITIEGGSSDIFQITSDTVINYGHITSQVDVQVNSAGLLKNYCRFYIYKGFQNNSVTTNDGSILLDPNNSSAIFRNNGVFVNGEVGYVQGYNFYNNSGDGITGGGSFYFKNSTSNSATFEGTAATKINFYDATPCLTCGGNRYFDLQSTNPQFTTKNIILPLSLSILEEPCGEPAPPVITVQPARVTNCDVSSNNKATFSVAAKSPYSAITYQWRKNGIDINNATQSTFTDNGLQLADTANVYTVALTNKYGTSISDGVGVKFVIVAQPSPASLYIATGSPAAFSITTSGAFAWQWKKNGSNVSGALLPVYNILSTRLDNTAAYTALVTYAGGTCLSSAASLKVEDRPIITAHPQSRVFCDTATKAITFSVTNATSQSPLSYQWHKNGVAIQGATSSSYTASNLTLADTASTYTAVLTNGVGSTTSNSAGFKYVIVSPPASVYAISGAVAVLTLKQGAPAVEYQWYKNGSKIDNAKLPVYTKVGVAQADSGYYTVEVKHAGGTCFSKAGILTVDAPPVVVAQPRIAQLCNTTATSATFSVVGASPYSAISYQWLKNGVPVTGATASSYTATVSGYSDTTAQYSVRLTNNAGTTTSNSTNVKYVIVSQPKNMSVVTGNAASFTIRVTGATAIQWFKSGSSIFNATGLSHDLPVVNTSDVHSYTALVTYAGGTCLSNAAKITPVTKVYSKATGNFDAPATWGANLDGTGSTPLDFTRGEHTFVVANRDTITSSTNHTIAGAVDINNSKFTIDNGTKLTVGRIMRSGQQGVIAVKSSTSLKLTGTGNPANAGASDLYFDAQENTIRNLATGGHTVNLRTPLNLTSGLIAGMLQVNSDTFNTFNQLTLKSDFLGTAFVYKSAGLINGMVTVEKYFPSRRAYRFICSPVAANGAPTINAAWQEGASSSSHNPAPGYGTHITFGATADGYDQNPQKSFSMFVLRNGSWAGVPAPKTTKVTDFPAYMMFIRGDRSYDIATTTSTTTPSSTVLRTTGNLNQGSQPDVNVAATGFALVGNPYASPIDFDLVWKASENIKKTARIWDPTLAGSKGVGAYVTIDWTTTGYITIPPSNMKNIIPAGQGFWVQTFDGTNPGTLRFKEDAKYIPETYGGFYNTFRGVAQREVEKEAMLEVDLKVFNEDGTTGIADGVLYHFGEGYNNAVDNNDIVKFRNLYENLSISNSSTLLTVDRRQAPTGNDTLQLNFTGSKTGNYQLEFVPKSFSNITVGKLFLYDRYLNSLTPLSNMDTTRVTISINTADAASKDANRFSITGQKQLVLPVTFTGAKAYAKNKTAQVEWTVAGEIDIVRYEVEKSANGTLFTKAGEVNATGAAAYSFNDAAPYTGTGYYRVKSVDKNGKSAYTKVMPVTIGTPTAALSIYPNPLKGKSFELQLSGMAAGSYTLNVVSNDGKQLYSKTIAHNGGTALYRVQLSSALANGVYFITATGEGIKETIKAIVQ